MLEICMCRHGQTNQNKLMKIQGQKDFPLNDVGKAQALKVGDFLNKNDNNFDLILSSPLSRAFDTAIILNKAINKGLVVKKDEAFIERCFGTAEGLDVSSEVFKDILIDNTNVYPGLETSKSIQERVVRRVLELEKEYNGKRILIVSHSHTIKALVTFVNRMYKFSDKLSNCSLCYFTIDNEKITLNKYNVETVGE